MVKILRSHFSGIIDRTDLKGLKQTNKAIQAGLAVRGIKPG
jgi:hypothetical protein